MGFSSATTECGGDVGLLCYSEEIDDEIAQACHYLGSETCSKLAAVLVHGHVPYPSESGRGGLHWAVVGRLGVTRLFEWASASATSASYLWVMVLSGTQRARQRPRPNVRGLFHVELPEHGL